MNNLRTITAAKDCVKQFSVRPYPLKNTASEMIAQRKLNSTERKVFSDLVFRWAREFYLFDQFIKERIKFSEGMSAQARNALAIDVFACLAELLPTQKAMAADYLSYVSSLGDERFLFSLAPIVRAELTKDYGAKLASEIAKGLLNDRAPKYFAFDRRKITAAELVEALTQMGITSFCHPYLATAIGTYDDFAIATLPSTVRDHVWLMDAGSQIIAELITPVASDHVLDMCAGEGNKARYITMHDCHFVAADIDGARLNKAKARLATNDIQWIVADGRALPCAEESFDWILLDAPCSGTGVLRRHPDLMHRLSLSSLKQSLSLQQELIASAITLLRPDGVLIYATCSIFRSENELQIAHTLSEKNSRVMAYPLKHLVGERIKLGSDALNDSSKTLFPHIDNCDGFFFSAIKKCRV